MGNILVGVKKGTPVDIDKTAGLWDVIQNAFNVRSYTYDITSFASQISNIVETILTNGSNVVELWIVFHV